MTTISIELPPIEADKSVEVEVRVNGKGRRYNYRVEVLKWEGCTSGEQRADCLRRMVRSYEKGWELMQIGSPTANEIPITFKRAN